MKTVRIDELLQEVDIFVVDVLDIILRQDVVGHIILRDYSAMLLKWNIVWINIVLRVLDAGTTT
jgi:hypothetical protein